MLGGAVSFEILLKLADYWVTSDYTAVHSTHNFCENCDKCCFSGLEWSQTLWNPEYYYFAQVYVISCLFTIVWVRDPWPEVWAAEEHCPAGGLAGWSPHGRRYSQPQCCPQDWFPQQERRAESCQVQGRYCTAERQFFRFATTITRQRNKSSSNKKKSEKC